MWHIVSEQYSCVCISAISLNNIRTKLRWVWERFPKKAMAGFVAVIATRATSASIAARSYLFSIPRPTMKVFSLAVVLAPPQQSSTILVQASDLSTFSFYQRGSVGEFLTFFSKTIAERTPQGQRQSVQENNYTAHVYNRGGAEQLAGKSHLVLSDSSD